MLITMGGKTFEASRGAVIVSPSFTLSCTAVTAFPTITFPEVSFTIVSACKIGTPLLTSVPKVRVNRAIATLLTTGPKTGTISLNLSNIRLPSLVLVKSLKAMNKQNTPIAVQIKWSLIMSLIASTNWVNSGSDSPLSMPLKISLNFGTTTTIRMPMMAVATTSTATG